MAIIRNNSERKNQRSIFFNRFRGWALKGKSKQSLALRKYNTNDGRNYKVVSIFKCNIPFQHILSPEGARMGNDPKTSVLNKHSQCHDAPNVFVTDGACMVSTACQNPSLTYMALTARAVDYAVEQLKRGELK